MNKKLLAVWISGLLLLIIISCGCFEEDNGDNPPEPDDNSPYISIEIVKLKGGTLKLANATFKCFSKLGTILYTNTIFDANPTSIVTGDTTAYPIPSGANPVTENMTTGDGEIVDSDSFFKPDRIEHCSFVFLDSESDGRLNFGDILWIIKDYNDDGINDVKPGYKFKIVDNEGNERLSKEL